MVRAWGLTVLASLLAIGSGSKAQSQVVLNELLAVNGRTLFDADGDSSDWLEIYNSGASPAPLRGFTLSDDPVLPGRWVFPDLSVPPRGYLLVWLSGKDVYLPAPSDLSQAQGPVTVRPAFIPAEDTWRYLVAVPGTPGPPIGWNQLGFDASSFAEGRAGFGYGDEDDFTELPDQTNAVFIRREFQVAVPAQVPNLVLEIDYDDGFIAYLNGVRVAAANAPAGNATFDTIATAGHEAGTAERFDLSSFRGGLVSGTNVLAVVGLNRTPSSDMSLHPRLGLVPGEVHANFRLSQAGEELTLRDPSGVVVDSVTFGFQTQDHSFGRSPNASGPWRYLLTPTPEAANESAAFDEAISTEVEFDLPPGKYAFPVQVSMFAQPAGQVLVHYTTDGSTPALASPLYTAPVPVNTSTVFRAAGFIASELATRVVSKSFFVGGTVQLPIISISMEPADFATVHNNSNARGRTSERESYLEFFDAQGVLAASTGFGMRLHGGAGRSGDFNTKKAYKAYFRGEYGDTKLRAPIIPDTPVEEFDKLVLRSGFNDCFRTNGAAAYTRDQLIRDLHEDMGGLVSHGSWCMLYVNMQLRGIYNVVERMDEEFLGSYFESEDWDVIKTGNDVLVGTIDEWERLRSFVVQNDLSQDLLFAQASQLLDLENFTSYMILNMWAQNHDWPHNNWYAARRRVPDGRWIFLSWDAEFGIGLIPGGYSSDSFAFTLSRTGYVRDIFDGFLRSPTYRAYFLSELDRHLAGALRPQSVLAHIRRLGNLASPGMPQEVQFFGRTYNDWLVNVAAMETFATNRGTVFRNFVRNAAIFGGGQPTPPRVDRVEPARVVNTGDAVVTLSGLLLGTIDEVYFNSIPGEIVGVVGFGLAIEVRLPFSAALSGSVTVRVVDRDSGLSAELRGGLVVDLPVPEPLEILPSQGSHRGGERVRIRGRYFLDGVRVYFGLIPAPSVERVGGATTEIEVLTPPGFGEVALRVENTRPSVLPAVSFLVYTYLGESFIRADANQSGDVDLSDAIAILGYLFLGTAALPCEAAADTDRGGEVDLSDAVAILAYLYGGGGAPATPFPDCGLALAGEPLGCEDGSACP
jgi:hypothetical protein